MMRLQGTISKRNAGFLRPWRSRPVEVTDDGFLRYTKKKSATSSGKAKEIDLVQSDIASTVVFAHGHYTINVQNGSKSFALGFLDALDADVWLEALHEVADENAAGRRAWIATLRQLLAPPLSTSKQQAPPVDRHALLQSMGDRDWVAEWLFCLRSLKSSDNSLRSRQRRLKRLYTIYVQFHLFAEIVADAFHTNADAFSTRTSTIDDVVEVRLRTLRFQVASSSWRGHKRLHRSVQSIAAFRAVVDFVASEQLVDAAVLDRLPSFPLLAAFAIGSTNVRVVATAEPLVTDRHATLTPLDRRDLQPLIHALQPTRLLRAFAFSDVPTLFVRRSPGGNSADQVLVDVTTRFDDVLMTSMRSPLVHGVRIFADANVPLDILTTHDVQELTQHCSRQVVPFMDVVSYHLTPASTVANKRASAFVGVALTGDVVIAIDDVERTNRIPLALRDAFVASQQLDVLPLVRCIEDVKTNAARIQSATSTSTSNKAASPLKVDAGFAIAKTAETSLKRLLLDRIRAFAASLVTLGDAPLEQQQQQQQQTTAKSSTFDTRAPLQRRPSSLANANNATTPTPWIIAHTYVIDAIDLRTAMRDAGINMRFLPLVFAHVDAVRQPGIQTLVACAIVARLAKLRWRSRRPLQKNATHAAIQLIDSILHGVFHDDLLPLRQCDIRECTGEQFWTVDAPLALLLGPMSANAALDPTCSTIHTAAAVAAYRLAVRNNPSALVVALLHALEAQLARSVLPALSESRFVTMAFLRTASDLVLQASDDVDDATTLMIEPTLLWSTAQFFSAHLRTLQRLASSQSSQSQNQSQAPTTTRDEKQRRQRPFDSFTASDSDPRSYFSDVVARMRFHLGLKTPLRIETALCEWDRVHTIRSRLVKALKAATDDDADAIYDSDDSERWTAARAFVADATELLKVSSDTAVFPIELLLAHQCLELASATDTTLLTKSADAWRRILLLLQFFFRPANAAQFTTSASSHPLFAIVYWLLDDVDTKRRQSGKTTKPMTLRTELERGQVQQTWRSVIEAVDAHCRRASTKSWTLDPVTAIATKVASRAFETAKAQLALAQAQAEETTPSPTLLHTLASNASTSSLLRHSSSTTTDDADDPNAADAADLRSTRTMRAMSAATERNDAAAAVRQDVLWFVESFLLPSIERSAWRVTTEMFAHATRVAMASTVVSLTLPHPAPGVALVWGEPFGLSLDDETQIAAAPSDSHLAALHCARPATDGITLLTLPSALRRVVHVACGYRHTALVADNRQLYTFGYGECGRLGHGDEASVDAPLPVGFFAQLIAAVGANVGGIAHVACGREHTIAVLVNGDVYGFGWAEAGRLGTGDTGCVALPTKVPTLHDVAAAACGREHTLVLTRTGDIFASGAGFGGRLGTGKEEDEEVFVRVGGGSLDTARVVKIDAGECHSAALTASGDVYTWGFGSSGALGTGTRENSLEPTKVAATPWTIASSEAAAPVTATSIACGGYHTLVSTSDGKLYGWGDAAAGQLGAAQLASPDLVVLAPVEIPFDATTRTPSAPAPAIREIASGTFTSAMCLDDGRVFQWGSAAAGNGAPLQHENAAVACVDALDEFAIARIACGAYHTVVLTRSLEFS